MTNTLRTPRQLSIIESIAHGEVGYSTYLGGFYFNRPLQFQFAAEDQDFLNALHTSGEIWHKPMNSVEFEVRLREAAETNAGDEFSERASGEEA